MIATALPLFDSEMNVRAYGLFTLKENMFENPQYFASGQYDGAGRIDGIEVINYLSIDTFSKDCEMIVPVNNVSIFSDIEGSYKGPRNRLVLLIDPSVKPDQTYLARLKELHDEGFKVAIRNLPTTSFEQYRPMLKLCEYIFLDSRNSDMTKLNIYFSSLLPNIKVVAQNVDTMEIFEKLVEVGGYTMYEGDFYRIPVTKGENEIAPIKMNYLELLKVVNKPDYDLTKAADIISRDPALTLSLLNIVNKLTINSKIQSIKQATAMLGQRELKKWISASAMESLCTDKPNEITRLSLLRGRFMENLSKDFMLASLSDSAFLTGLFSVIDIILEKPMDEALTQMNVDKNIVDALANDTGPFAECFDFLLSYEKGDWQAVSRTMLLKKLNMDSIYEAYLESLKWYESMFM